MKIYINILLLQFGYVSGYKVLVFSPAYGASHSNFLGKLSDVLIDAGHEVTMLIPIFEENKKHLVGSKKVKNIIRIPQDPRIAKIHSEGATDEIVRKKIWRMSPDITAMLPLMRNFIKASGVQYIFQQDDLLKRLEEEKFDLAMSESFFICAFALFERIGVRSVINTDSVLFVGNVKSALGEPASASYFPDIFTAHHDKMSFLARAKHMFAMMFTSWFTTQKSEHELDCIRNLYNVTKTGEEYLAGVAFNFVNSNRFIDFASPTLPKTVFVGGMQVDTKKKNGTTSLPKEWNDVLNERNQTVLVSFGSMAHSADMPNEFKSAFLEVFASMPETTFIWKYEEANATLADHLPNVKLTTWMPQNDLLADDRLTLFITHGGLGSSVELAYQGKPAIVIPLGADQPRNAFMLTRHAGAIQLDKAQLDNPDVLKNAIRTILSDESYKQNAQKLGSILKDQPHSPKDVVLKHCDFAVKYGALETLNSEGRHLNAFQFYSIDIALVALVTIFIFIVLALKVVSLVRKVIVNWLYNSKQKTE